MIRETYKGRKIVITKGREYGYSLVTLNGTNRTAYLGKQDDVLQKIKNSIDFIDRDPVVDGSKWDAKWYEPGTYEMCAEGSHPQAIGGPCRHPYCVKHASA